MAVVKKEFGKNSKGEQAYFHPYQVHTKNAVWHQNLLR